MPRFAVCSGNKRQAERGDFVEQEKSRRCSFPAVWAIIAAYLLLSLYRLGYCYAPSSGWMSLEKGKTIILDMGKEQNMGSLSWYLGNYERRRMEISIGSQPPVSWTRLPDLEMNRVWQWGIRSLNTKGRYIKLTALNQYTEIKELIVKDPQGNAVVPVNAAKYPELFDEAFMDPGYGSPESGTVFDESLFARTAYEYLHGIRSYEDTHPPLGKLLISIGIACFGMNPFGWRISGVAAGVLLLAAAWLFADRLLKHSWAAAGTTALLALDFLHFTESRLGQIDSFLVLFMTSMYYFMYRYYEEAREGRRGWRYLAASGFFFGLAVSCKWSGFYGGAGLAFIWLLILIKRFRNKETSWRELWKICGASTLFFVAVPAAVYVLSYIPYVAADETKGFVLRVLENQSNMFQYHSGLSGTHESASPWYQWPLILKPVKLYAVNLPNGKTQLLTFMGNPGLWWPGAAIVFACLYRLTGKKDDKMLFLVIAYLAPLLPWIFISRYAFLYHYYPSVPFMALLMGLWADQRGRAGKRFLFGCVAASGILFLLFYPILSGVRTDQNYVSQWLQWLPTWKFAA